MRRKGNPSVLLMGTQTGAATMESNMEVLQKIKNTTTRQSRNFTSRYISEGNYIIVSKRYLHPLWSRQHYLQ